MNSESESQAPRPLDPPCTLRTVCSNHGLWSPPDPGCGGRRGGALVPLASRSGAKREPTTLQSSTGREILPHRPTQQNLRFIEVASHVYFSGFRLAGIHDHQPQKRLASLVLHRVNEFPFLPWSWRVLAGRPWLDIAQSCDQRRSGAKLRSPIHVPSLDCLNSTLWSHPSS